MYPKNTFKSLNLKFPGKKWIGDNTSEKFIKERCKQLEDYLNKMMELPGILDIEEVWRICVLSSHS
jgi:hypothetical protein